MAAVLAINQRFIKNVPDRIRTCDPRLRRPLLYPTELQTHIGSWSGVWSKRVMGIEPTYPAWKAGVLPLNYTRVSVRTMTLPKWIGVTGFEPATSWSQTRRSSQAEPHPVNKVSRFAFNPFALDARFIILHCFRFVNTFFHFFQNVFCVVLFSPDNKKILSYLFSSVNT